jgi:hypothetical protein
LPSSAFLQCAQAEESHNTLFNGVRDHRNVKYDDLTTYLDLVVRMYELSPEGCISDRNHLCSLWFMTIRIDLFIVSVGRRALHHLPQQGV